MRFPYIPMPATMEPLALDLDTDADTEVGMPLDDFEVCEAKMVENSPSFTDFSSFLDVSTLDGGYNTTSITVVGSDASAQSSEDLYGWEAELDRKVKCGITNTDVCKCGEFEYRRANGSKRGLLHRVFSSGRRPS
jgi:hypothetical protein